MKPQDALAFAINRARWNSAAFELRIRVARLSLEILGFDPNRPRVPAGQSGGGQWTDAEGPGDARLTYVQRMLTSRLSYR